MGGRVSYRGRLNITDWYTCLVPNTGVVAKKKKDWDWRVYSARAFPVFAGENKAIFSMPYFSLEVRGRQEGRKEGRNKQWKKIQLGQWLGSRSLSLWDHPRSMIHHNETLHKSYILIWNPSVVSIDMEQVGKYINITTLSWYIYILLKVTLPITHELKRYFRLLKNKMLDGNILFDRAKWFSHFTQ